MSLSRGLKGGVLSSASSDLGGVLLSNTLDNYDHLSCLKRFLVVWLACCHGWLT